MTQIVNLSKLLQQDFSNLVYSIEIFSSKAEVEEKADAAQTAPTAYDSYLWHKAGAEKLGIHNILPL